MIFRCKIYENRPEWCKGYPWNEANDIFPDCQFVFVQDGTTYLLPEEQILEHKTEEEIEKYCLHCGKCCMYWDEGECIHYCTSLIVEEDMPKSSGELPLEQEQADLEQERQEDLIDARAIHREDMEEHFAPGSFGCHELLDRLSMVESIWNGYVVGNPATIIDPEFYKEARGIANAIARFYQKVGTKHLCADDTIRGSALRVQGKISPADEAGI